MQNRPPSTSNRSRRGLHESKSATVRAAAAAPSRRQQSHWQREQQHQHWLYIAVGVLVAVVAAIFAGGLVYDNVIRANEVVAQVGPDNVTASQLLNEARPAAKSIDAQARALGSTAGVASYVDSQKRSLPDQVMNDVIDEHLIQQEAAGRGITVSPAELDDKQRQTVADFNAAVNPSPTAEPSPTSETASPVPAVPPIQGTPTPNPTLDASGYGPALQQLLDRNGLSEPELRFRLEQNMLRDKLQTAIGQDSVPSTQEQVHARHILVASEDQANDILNQLKGGADFASLAQQFSTDPGSKDKGGDLGWFGRGSMDKPFGDAAFALNPGELSGVVHGANGYHVIQVLEKDPARAVPDAQLTTQRQKAFSDWLTGRRTSQDVKLQFSQGAHDWVLTRIGVRS